MNIIKLLNIASLLLLSLLWPLSAAHSSPLDLNFKTQESLDAYIEAKEVAIAENPTNALAHLQRADAKFLAHDFEAAIKGYSRALALESGLLDAYFGRGLALARAGRVEQGISDFDVYIKAKPNSSIAYTKRGVRYIWVGQYDSAERDLKKAISLDKNNAEAHDDLGVVYAQKKKYIRAAKHFSAAITLQPSYQKAYHNMAVVGFITGNDALALNYVNRSLQLLPQSRSSMLLKSEILNALGRLDEATEVKDDADFLPIGNWSENVTIE